VVNTAGSNSRLFWGCFALSRVYSLCGGEHPREPQGRAQGRAGDRSLLALAAFHHLSSPCTVVFFLPPPFILVSGIQAYVMRSRGVRTTLCILYGKKQLSTLTSDLLAVWFSRSTLCRVPI